MREGRLAVYARGRKRVGPAFGGIETTWPDPTARRPETGLCVAGKPRYDGAARGETPPELESRRRKRHVSDSNLHRALRAARHRRPGLFQGRPALGAAQQPEVRREYRLA